MLEVTETIIEWAELTRKHFDITYRIYVLFIDFNKWSTFTAFSVDFYYKRRTPYMKTKIIRFLYLFWLSKECAMVYWHSSEYSTVHGNRVPLSLLWFWLPVYSLAVLSPLCHPLSLRSVLETLLAVTRSIYCYHLGAARNGTGSWTVTRPRYSEKQIACQKFQLVRLIAENLEKLPIGGSRPTSITWFIGPTWVNPANGISISLAVLAQYVSVTNTQTHRPHYVWFLSQ